MKLAPSPMGFLNGAPFKRFKSAAVFGLLPRTCIFKTFSVTEGGSCHFMCTLLGGHVTLCSGKNRATGIYVEENTPASPSPINVQSLSNIIKFYSA